jgi:hypothetical protein
MAWFGGTLALTCVLVGALHLLRLVVLRRDMVGEASHAAMGLGMAAMFSPLGDPVPRPVWAGVFALCAAWFAVLALRAGGPDARHHVVGSAAMLFMLLGGTHVHAVAGGGEHAGHGAAAAGGLGVAPVAAIVLAGYFAWHALRCIDRMRPGVLPAVPAAEVAANVTVALRAPALSLRAPQTAAVAHLVMAVAMAAMLLGMV